VVVAYWIVASLLALMYLYSGGTKVLRSRQQLQPLMGWVETTPMAAVRTIGVLEVAGAVGLIVPPLTGVLPWLAIAAASGLVLVQVGAFVVHIRRHEFRVLGLNAVLLVLACVAIGLATVWV
jgi:uncharacterized membrane protein